MEPAKIRLELVVDGSNQATISGFDQFAKMMDSSIQYAANKSASYIEKMHERMDRQFKLSARLFSTGFVNAFKQLDAHFQTTNASLAIMSQHLDRLVNKIQRLRSMSGGGGIGGLAKSGRGNPTDGEEDGFDLEQFLSEQMDQGFRETGRFATAATRAGKRIAQEFGNELGKAMMVRYDQQGRLSSVRIGMGPKETPEQRDMRRAQTALARELERARVRGEKEKIRKLEKDESYLRHLRQVSEANQRHHEFLQQRGFQHVATRYQFTPQGTVETKLFRDAVGSLMRLTENTGRLVSGGASRGPARTPEQELLWNELRTARRRAREEYRLEKQIDDYREKKLSRERELFNRMQSIADANRRHMTTLSHAGYRHVSTRIDDTPQGRRQTLVFQDADGRIARLNEWTGRLRGNLPAALTSWERFVQGVRVGSRHINTAMSGILHMPAAIRNAFITLAATIYSVERVGRFVNDALVRPAKRILENTEEARLFQLSISGVTGGLGRARAVNEALARSAMDSPLTMDERRQIGRQFTLLPSQAATVASSNPEQIAGMIDKFGTLVNKLALLDPQQGVKGALISLREAFAGDFRSLRLRMEISPEAVAASIGKTVPQLKADQDLTRRALERYSDIYISDEAIQEMANLYSRRMEKMWDTVRRATERVGESGVFDAVVDRLRKFTSDLHSHVESHDFMIDAARISQSFDRAIGGVLESIEGFVRGITGKEVSIRTVSGQFTDVIENLSRSISSLQYPMESLGAVLRGVANTTTWVVEKYSRLGSIKYLTDAATGGYFDRRQAIYSLLEGMNPPATPLEADRTTTAHEAKYGELAKKLDVILRDVAIEQTRDGWRFQDLEWAARLVAKSPESQKMGPKWSVELDRVAAYMQSVANNWQKHPLYSRSDKVEDIIHLTPEQLSQAKFRILDTVSKANVPAVINAHGMGMSELRDSFSPDLLPLMRFAGGANRYMSGFYSQGEEGKQGYAPPLIERITLVLQQIVDTINREKNTPEGRAVEAQDPEFFTNKLRDAMLEYQAYITGPLRNQLEGQAKEFGTSIALVSRELPPPEALRSLNDVVRGLTAASIEANKVMRHLEQPPIDASFNAMAPEQRDAVLTSMRHQVDQYKQHLSRYGQLPEFDKDVGRDIDTIMSIRPMDSYQSARAALAHREETMLPLFQQNIHHAAMELDTAMESGNQGKILIATQNLARARSELHQLSIEIQSLRVESDATLKSFVDFSDSARKSLDNGLGQGIYNLITQAGTLRDAFHSMAQDILRAFSQMASQNLMYSMIGNFGRMDMNGNLSPLGGIIGRLLGGTPTAPTPDVPAADVPLGPPAPAAVSGYANGGVLNGRFIPFRAFANGGIADRPTLGLIAEGKYKEAVVPLPDGRSIPVEMRSKEQRQSQNIYVVSSQEEAFLKGFNKHRDLIIDLVAADVAGGGKVQKAMGRRG